MKMKIALGIERKLTTSLPSQSGETSRSSVESQHSRTREARDSYPHRMGTLWTTEDIPLQEGKRIVVTGANSGIGWYTALSLARAGADVTIASRKEKNALEAVARIRAILPAAILRTGVIDLSDPLSVAGFAKEQLADPQPIDILINNAGVMALPKRLLSIDCHELQFATNMLGPFRLTGMLLPSILSAKAPRVVTVSSYAHRIGGPVPVQDLDSEQGYKPVRAYAKTKLEEILFTRELQRRAGRRLLATCCHPGASRTNLARNTTLGMKLLTWLINPMMQTAAQGAEPTLMAATLAGAQPGAYYGPGGFLKLRGHPVQTETAPFADDMDAAQNLFERLERITGTQYDL